MSPLSGTFKMFHSHNLDTIFHNKYGISHFTGVKCSRFLCLSDECNSELNLVSINQSPFMVLVIIVKFDQVLKLLLHFQL